MIVFVFGGSGKRSKFKTGIPSLSRAKASPLVFGKIRTSFPSLKLKIFRNAGSSFKVGFPSFASTATVS